MSSNAPKRIGVWGPPSSGKSVFLFVLYNRASDPNWQLRIPPGPEADATEEYIKNGWNALEGEESAMSAATVGSVDLRLMLVKRNMAWGLEIADEIRWTDIAGEFLMETPKDLYAILDTCDAILCFLDPQLDMDMVREAGFNSRTMRDFYEDRLRNLFDHLYRAVPSRVRGNELTQHFCFVITKVDATEELWNMCSRPDDLLESVAGKRAVKLIRERCASYKIYPCSSVGARLTADGSYEGPNIKVGGQARDSKGVLRDFYVVVETDARVFVPVNVIEPLIWLVRKLHRRR